jgi:PPK2 family polyphosphate:nucleotide phosphotransferase
MATERDGDVDVHGGDDSTGQGLHRDGCCLVGLKADCPVGSNTRCRTGACHGLRLLVRDDAGMKLPPQVIEELMVAPGEPAGLAHRGTSETRYDWLSSTGHAKAADLAERDLEKFKDELTDAQQLLYAGGEYALLLIFQALDAAGKDGTIKHVMSGVNPQGCKVVSFRQPSEDELAHDFLWRCVRALPRRGQLGIFNRSYYEEVLVVRVHPELLDRQRLPNHREHLWKERYEDINCFERHLHREGTRVVKFFLHISKEEQRQRFLARLDNPEKRWKFSSSDVAEREHWEEYQRAYEDALSATSTAWAPWYVIPADHKPAMRALVGGIVVHTIEQLHLKTPSVGADELESMERDRQALISEAPK